MKITIHRGAKEIGGTCIQIESGMESLVIDVGLPLVDDTGKEFSGTPESVLPNIPGMFQAGESCPAALLLTHAHADHYGLLDFVNDNIPVYSSEGTKRLVGITSNFSQLKFDVERINTVEAGKMLSIGPFKVTPYLVDHSAPDAFAWLIEVDCKRVLYTGDIRAGGRKKALFEDLLTNGPEEMDAILLEGTTMGRTDPEFNSEEEIEKEIARFCNETKGLVAVFSSGQNIDRIVSLLNAAQSCGREFVIDIYVAHVLRLFSGIEGNPDLKRDDVRVFYPFHLSKRLAEDDKKKWLFPFRASRISSDELREKPGRYLMLLRPSMWFDIDKRLNMEDALAVWSMWRGYLSKSQNERFINTLKKHSVPMKQVHFGGHAGINDLVLLVDTLKPKKVIPIHTFHADKYDAYFPNVHQLSDGQALIL